MLININKTVFVCFLCFYENVGSCAPLSLVCVKFLYHHQIKIEKLILKKKTWITDILLDCQFCKVTKTEGKKNSIWSQLILTVGHEQFICRGRDHQWLASMLIADGKLYSLYWWVRWRTSSRKLLLSHVKLLNWGGGGRNLNICAEFKFQ